MVREPAEALCLQKGWGLALGSSVSGLLGSVHCDGRSDYNLTFSFQDMFDPHGWSEDSYYEALGNLLAFCLSTHPHTHPSVHPLSDLGDP